MTAAERAAPRRRVGILIRRFLVPSLFVSLYAYLRSRVSISPRAEVELSPNLRLGRGTTVGSFTKIKTTDGPVVTGVRCTFGTGCFVDPGRGGITIGDHSLIGPNVAIVAVNYSYDDPAKPLQDQGVTSTGISIGRNVWIGANSTLVDGAAVGDNSIVVANSLVNKVFPADSIIQGNPARVVFSRAGR